MNLLSLERLVAQWRAEADQMLVRGAEDFARCVASLASELEAKLIEWEQEPLTLSQAAAESGYSYSHLHRLVAEEKVKNVGAPRAPRIRRTDLPRKPPIKEDPSDFADRILNARRR